MCDTTSMQGLKKPQNIIGAANGVCYMQTLPVSGVYRWHYTNIRPFPNLQQSYSIGVITQHNENKNLGF